MDLARRGVRTLLLERSTTPRRLPKMERCNARTMEIFRRLGLEAAIRKASLFTPMPMDIFIMASFSRPPLLHLSYPSVPEAKQLIAQCGDGTLPLEPAQLISQYTLEPILRDAAAQAGVDVRYGAEVSAFTQDDEGVSVSINGAAETVRGRYLVGCDGGVSTVRKQLGIELQGRGRIKLIHQVFFRSEQLFAKIPTGRGRHYYFAEGAIVVQDDLRHFMVNFQDWQPGQDAVTRLRQMIDLDIDIEVLSEADWRHHLLVAERYRGGRALIAGDAAHLVIPQGGLGMNTGIGDAIDLAWKLAGTVHGWAGPALLDSYDAEHREIGLRNRDASGAAAQGVGRWRAAVRPCIRDDSAEGEANRREVSALAAEGQPMSHEMHGIELGYRYSKSPVIAAEESPVESTTCNYLPNATPGVRLPHVWREDGSPVHEGLGNDYTLLALEPDGDTASIEAAMKRIGAPMQLARMPEAHLRRIYEKRLLLIRPDLHVAWRGDRLPDDADALARLVTGRG